MSPGQEGAQTGPADPEQGLNLQLEDQGPGPHAAIYQLGDPVTLQASVLASGKWVHCEE